MSIKIKYEATKDLNPYENNSRAHTPHQISQIARSIEEFGFLNPILIDDNKTLIAGHARLEAAKNLGIQKVPTILAGHLTDQQRRAYVIADNKLAQNSSWNDEILKLEIEGLEMDGFDMTLLGWDVLPTFTQDIDYSILDELNDNSAQEMAQDVKRAIQIEFEAADYEEASRLIKVLREQGVYVGGLILEALAGTEE